MAFMLSPGVQVREFDLTNIVPGVSTTEAGLAGMFSWGPCDQRILINSETTLVKRFWKPNATEDQKQLAHDWFTAANFLAYGDKLWLVRVVDSTNGNEELRAKNATASSESGTAAGTGWLIKNEDDYEHHYMELGNWQGDVGDWVARYPGVLGNSLKISVCPSAAAFESTLTGTLSIDAGNTFITGVGTDFETELVLGDLVVLGDETHKVAAIANGTSMTIAHRHVGGLSANTVVRRWEYYNVVDTAPGTSDHVATAGGSNDEMHIVIVDEDGAWTGVNNQPVEVYQKVSKASNAKLEDGSTNYYKEVIHQKSFYAYWSGHGSGMTNAGKLAKNTAFGIPALPLNYSLSGGQDGGEVGNQPKVKGYDLFRSSEDIDVSIILGSDANQTIATHIINNILEHRRDCVGFFSPLRSYCVDNVGHEAVDIVTFRNTLPVTSYAALDGNWKKQYDKYNDIYRWLPCNGDVGGVHVRTDTDRDAWWAAAGFNRGHIKNTITLAWNPRNAERDILYKNNVNPIATFPGEGTVLFGQKTLLSKPSAFDRLNVRRLFIVLEKAISKAAKYLLFEFNDEFTRAQFRNMVEPFLRDVQGRRGIYDFLVVCDETNNTPEVIDRNEFVGDIYIKPARVAEFIRLNFVAVRTGVAFEEIVGKFGG